MLSGQIGATGRKMNNEKFKKINISIPSDLYRWIKEKQEDLKKLYPLGRFDVSPIIADCIRAKKESEEGKAKPVAGVVIRPASANFVSGRSIPARKTSRKAG